MTSFSERRRPGPTGRESAEDEEPAKEPLAAVNAAPEDALAALCVPDAYPKFILVKNKTDTAGSVSVLSSDTADSAYPRSVLYLCLIFVLNLSILMSKKSYLPPTDCLILNFLDHFKKPSDPHSKRTFPLLRVLLQNLGQRLAPGSKEREVQTQSSPQRAFGIRIERTVLQVLSIGFGT